MKVPYAWLDLVHDRGRSAVAVVGVAFASLLILMQLGFYGSVERTAVLIQEHLVFDILLCSRNYRFISSPGLMPADRLQQAQAAEGVAAVRPFNLGFLPWRSGATRDVRRQARSRAIMIMGIEPDLPALDMDRIGASADALRDVDDVLIDSQSRPEFGPQTAGTLAEAGARTVTVAGAFTMGTGFGADGAIIASMRTFARALPAFSPAKVSLGLVSVRENADVDAVAARLRQILPADVRVLTRGQLAASERRHWIIKTSVGVIFLTGVITSLIVGMAIVSQVLGNKVSHHFKEYATMKALGYSQRYISGVVLLQAAAIAVIGYLPGLAVAWQLYGWTREYAHIPMSLGAREAGIVLCIAVAMCVTAALTALRKVALAAPADLF
jgi:putative ABC transport system permease protein